MKAILCAITTLMLSSPARADDKIGMKLGLWEMTGDTDLGGQKVAVPRIEHCVTAKDLDGSWFQQLPPEADCQTDQAVTASTVEWTLSCKMAGGGSISSTGKVKYTATKFTGSATMKMKIPNMGTQHGKSTFSGRYLGSCKR